MQEQTRRKNQRKRKKKKAELPIITDIKQLPVKLTVAHAAAYFQVSESAIYLWVEKAEGPEPPENPIPFHRLPGTKTIRFDRDKLLAWPELGKAAR
ncbi:MAG: helix-turn-helix transcriptional regulator [Blastocatellia bacterium]